MPSNPQRVAISAIGCVSPLGVGLAPMLESLRSAKDCVSPITSFDVTGAQGQSAGQVTELMIEAGTHGVGTFADLDRAKRMVFAALDEARAMQPDFVPELAVIGTTSGGMLFGEQFFRGAVHQCNHRAAARLVRSYVPQAPVLDALQSVGWHAPCRVLSNACASGTNALGHAFSLIRNGRHRRILCGGYDVFCELVFSGFDALRAYTPGLCRPFDAGRTGLVLGEGAALFFVESVDDALAAGRTVLAEITGYGTSTDNHHLTQPNPDGNGPQRAMERALAMAGIQGDSIDYVNAHGTATPFNDACEAVAISAVCPAARVSSTKGQMGHSLGAAGAIEAAVCVLAMKEEFFPANLHFSSPDDGVSLDIVTPSTMSGAPRRTLSNSLGFGGANASILLEKFQL